MRTLDQQLEQLNVELIRMGALCEEGIMSAIRALMEHDREAGARAIAIELETDRKERDIETLCMHLFLRCQPVAGDLRTVSSALKMISDMERIGDQVEDIAEIAKLSGIERLTNEVHIKKMAEEAVRMVIGSIDSFVKKDLSLAQKVIESDDNIDSMFEQIKQELIDEINKDRRNGEVCLNLLMVAKYLERIGDHAVNIAEWVEYSMTGEHRKDKL